jgi:hypothetical protein
VAVLSKLYVNGRSLGIAVSNPDEGTEVCICDVVCPHVEVSAMGGSLVQRSPTKCVHTRVLLLAIRCNCYPQHLQ